MNPQEKLVDDCDVEQYAVAQSLLTETFKLWAVEARDWRGLIHVAGKGCKDFFLSLFQVSYQLSFLWELVLQPEEVEARIKLLS